MKNNKIISSRDLKNRIIKNGLMFFLYFIYDLIILMILELLDIDTSSWSNLQKNIYLISTSFFYLIIVIVVYFKELTYDLKKIKGKLLDTLLKYIPIYIIGVILMSLSNLIISHFTGVAVSENETNVRNYIQLFPIYMAFSTVIYAPIVEEITFRKTFKNIFSNKYLFIILSGVIFGFVHISSISSYNDFLMIIPYIIMGLDLSYIYYKTDNIFITMLIHSLHNLILLIIQLIGG